MMVKDFAFVFINICVSSQLEIPIQKMDILVLKILLR